MDPVDAAALEIARPGAARLPEGQRCARLERPCPDPASDGVPQVGR
jgi:hypothetical protein